MRNEETIVAITEITCGGNIYCHNCYDIWVAEWRNRGFIESVGTSKIITKRQKGLVFGA